MSEQVLQEARAFSTLGTLMAWAFARTPPLHLADVVTQDEFTHDVILKTDADLFLVFDTT